MSDKEPSAEQKSRWSTLAIDFLSKHCKDHISEAHTELMAIFDQCWERGYEAGFKQQRQSAPQPEFQKTVSVNLKPPGQQ